MEHRSEGQILADDVDLWYKDQFLDSILAKKAIAEEDRLPDNLTPIQRWKNIFFTTITALTLSTGPVIPAFSPIRPSNTVGETIRVTDCQSLTHTMEIICPRNHLQPGSIGQFFPIPSRLPYINP